MSQVTAGTPAAVSPTSVNPEYDVTLTDGTTTLGFVVVNETGEKDYRGFRDRPIEQTAIKTSQGDNSYSDRAWPYIVLAQEDWSGGRGAAIFEDDKTKFYDSYRVQTERSGQTILGGLATYTKVNRTMQQNSFDTSATSWPIGASITSWRPIYGTYRFFATKFTAEANYTVSSVYVYVKKVGSPSGYLRVAIYDDSAGTPGSAIYTDLLTPSAVNISQLQDYWGFAVGSVPLTSGTSYWILIYGETAHDASNHWTIGMVNTQFGGNYGYRSSAGSSWTLTSENAYLRIVDETYNSSLKLLEYKGQLYCYNVEGNPTLYINGDRGAADSNSGNLNKLIDATKSWTTNEWVGCTVLITSGLGLLENKPWRYITSNTGTQLTVSPNWTITQNTTTEYVILGSNKWTAIETLTNGVVTDHVVAPDWIYFAQSEPTGVTMYQAYNNAGTWTDRIDYVSSGYVYASRLQLVRDSDTKNFHLYGTQNSQSTVVGAPVKVWKAQVPRTWGGLFVDKGELVPTNCAWSDRIITNVTQAILDGHTWVQIGAGFTTGIAAVKNLDEPVNIREANGVGAYIKSSVATSSGDLKLVLEDNGDLGKYYSPVAAYYNEAHEGHLANVAGNAAATAVANWYDGDLTTGTAFSFTTSNNIYVGSSAMFDRVKVELGSTVNNIASVLSATYWDGDEWVAVTITDGTIVTGKTMAQDGTISFTAPNKWESRVLAMASSAAYYYLKFAVTVNLTPNVDFNEFRVSQVNTFVALPEMIDGQTATYDTLPDLTTEDKLYIAHTDRFNKIDVDMGATVNAVAATLTCEYFNGSRWTATTVTDGTASGGATLAQDGVITISTVPYDWEPAVVGGQEAYWIRVYPSANLTQNITINSVRVARNNNIELSVPALTAGMWQWVQIANDSTNEPIPSDVIQSVALKVSTDLGAQWVEIDGLRMIVMNLVTPPYFEVESIVNNIGLYSGDETGGFTNAWLFTRKSIQEIQAQNNDAVVPLPVGELGDLGGSALGKAWCVNGVYLYFSLNGDMIERYYNKNLDDVSPDMSGLGLLSTNRGDIDTLLSYPGKVFAVVDGGAANYSSILMLKGNAWHEVYRSPSTGDRIRGLYHQPVEGMPWGKLWFSQSAYNYEAATVRSSDLLWIPVAIDPYQETQYPYTHDGYLITAWMYGGMKDVEKAWGEIKAFCENITTNYEFVEADYQLDDDTSWTPITGTYAGSTIYGTYTFPLASSTTLTDVRGNRIRFRIRLYTIDTRFTPRVVALVVRGYGVVPIKYEYTWATRLENKYMFATLDGKRQNVNVSTNYAKLKEWINAARPLKMNTRNGLDDGKIVVLQACIKRPRWQHAKETVGQREEWMLDVAVSEI